MTRDELIQLRWQVKVLTRERDDAKKMGDRVRLLHGGEPEIDDSTDTVYKYCPGCGDLLDAGGRCATIRALDGA